MYMRRLQYHFIFLLVILTTPLFAQTSYEKCGYDAVFEELIQTDPYLANRTEALEKFTSNWISNQMQIAEVRDIITIPVVVHVVWNHPSDNISAFQIQSQIAILNEDFRMLNDNVSIIPDEFIGLAADIGIEFCLATLDPDGHPTNGITRTETTYEKVGNLLEVVSNGTPRIFHTTLGGKDAWNPGHYVNIWVADMGDLLGFGAAPQQFTDPNEDGIIVDPDSFGNTCRGDSKHQLGRTATHEMGHYFNLQHIWGKTGCNEDDFVDDTPDQDRFHTGCPTHPSVSCGSNDMFMNFMDYSEDACIAMFTHGQKLRMLAVLSENGPRYSLTQSNGCGLLDTTPKDNTVTIYPNPANQCVHVDFNTNMTGKVIVSLFDNTGRLIYKEENNASNIQSIPVEDYPEGIYFLNISNNTKTSLTEKVFIIN